jgi:plasminogen activator inhibitor 1 RNA-binding protein
LLGWGADLAATGDAPAGDAWGGGGDDANANSHNVIGATNGNAETRRAREKDEEEDNSLTLDEYLAKKAKDEAAAIPKLETVRQANEGVDQSLWKDAIPLAKGKEESNYFVGKVRDSMIPSFPQLINVLADQVGS